MEVRNTETSLKIHDLETTHYSEPYISIGSLSYNTATQCLSSDDNSIYLRCKLDQVLRYLNCNKHRLVSREELIHNVWSGNGYTGNKAVTHTICKLRQSFNQLGEDKASIKTLPKKGYVLVTG